MEFGLIMNQGSLCRACRLRVCKGCREYSNGSVDWVCVVCQNQM